MYSVIVYHVNVLHNVHILELPGAPVDLRTTVVSSNSVQLCWIEDPDTYLVSAYHIFIYSERSSANRTIQERYMLDDHTCVKVCR